MKNFKPRGKYVLIHIEKKDSDGMKKTKAGILLMENKIETPGGGGSQATPGSHNFKVEAIGPDVEAIKAGDLVIFNEYDVKFVQDEDEQAYAICKEESIFATYED